VLGFKPKTGHGKRFITASLIIPVLFIILNWGGSFLFVFLVWAGLSLGNREFFYLIYSRPSKTLMAFHWFMGSLAVWGAYLKGLEGLFLALIVASVLSLTYLILTFPNQKPFYDHLGKQIFSLWYLPLYIPFFILIRMENHGLHWIFFLLAVNYAGDTGAYYVGRTWGRHKLAPLVSPKKTVEGSLGGLAANLITAFIFQKTLFPEYHWAVLIALGLTLGVVSQLGDLLESVFKRTARIKDSGSIFPGHGGLLDRVDSLLLPAPLLYFFIRFF
jgi:phosphatidate cytidylyltransferase